MVIDFPQENTKLLVWLYTKLSNLARGCRYRTIHSPTAGDTYFILEQMRDDKSWYLIKNQAKSRSWIAYAKAKFKSDNKWKALLQLGDKIHVRMGHIRHQISISWNTVDCT